MELSPPTGGQVPRAAFTIEEVGEAHRLSEANVFQVA